MNNDADKAGAVSLYLNSDKGQCEKNWFTAQPAQNSSSNVILVTLIFLNCTK